MKQKSVRRPQNIPVHKINTLRVNFVIDQFKKYHLPMIGDINYMYEWALQLEEMNKEQVESLRKTLDSYTNMRIINDKYAK